MTTQERYQEKFLRSLQEIKSRSDADSIKKKLEIAVALISITKQIPPKYIHVPTGDNRSVFFNSLLTGKYIPDPTVHQILDSHVPPSDRIHNIIDSTMTVDQWGLYLSILSSYLSGDTPEQSAEAFNIHAHDLYAANDKKEYAKVIAAGTTLKVKNAIAIATNWGRITRIAADELLGKIEIGREHFKLPVIPKAPDPPAIL